MAIYYLLMSTATALMAPLIPSYVVDVGLDMGSLGLAASLSALSTALLLPTMGYIADRFSRKTALLATVSIRLSAFILFATYEDPLLALTAYALYEFGFILYLPIARAIVAEAAGPENMGRAYGELITIVSLCEIVFPVVSGQIYNFVGDYMTMFRWIAALAIGSTPILLFLRDSRGYPTLKYRNIFRLSRMEKRIFIPAILESVSWRVWIFLLYVTPKDVLGLGPDVLGLAYTLQSMVWFLTQYISGILVDRIGAKKLYILSDSIGIPIALIYAYMLTPYTFILATSLFGLSISLWIPAFNRMIYEASTEETIAITYSKVDSMRYLFSTPMAYIGGWMYESIWIGAPFIVGIALIAADVILEYRMFPDV